MKKYVKNLLMLVFAVFVSLSFLKTNSLKVLAEENCKVYADPDKMFCLDGYSAADEDGELVSNLDEVIADFVEENNTPVSNNPKPDLVEKEENPFEAFDDAKEEREILKNFEIDYGKDEVYSEAYLKSLIDNFNGETSNITVDKTVNQKEDKKPSEVENKKEVAINTPSTTVSTTTVSTNSNPTLPVTGYQNSLLNVVSLTTIGLGLLVLKNARKHS